MGRRRIYFTSTFGGGVDARRGASLVVRHALFDVSMQEPTLSLLLIASF
jgi:hypothetical protein